MEGVDYVIKLMAKIIYLTLQDKEEIWKVRKFEMYGDDNRRKTTIYQLIQFLFLKQTIQVYIN